MPSNALVQARISAQIKEEAATVLAAMGLTVSDAVRMLLTRIASDQTLPFDPFTPSATTIAAMQEARRNKLQAIDTLDALTGRIEQGFSKLTRYEGTAAIDEAILRHRSKDTQSSNKP